VITATNKANQMLGRIKKSFGRFDRKLFRSLYLTFIRPLLEFAVPVWCPILKSYCENIERIQHRATKMVSSISNLPYSKRLKALDITTLVERRKRGDRIQLYKIMHVARLCMLQDYASCKIMHLMILQDLARL
jgi:hypothetical protein